MAESKVSEGSEHVRGAVDLQLLCGRVRDIAVASCGIGGTEKPRWRGWNPQRSRGSGWACLVIVIDNEHFLRAKTTIPTTVNMPCSGVSNWFCKLGQLWGLLHLNGQQPQQACWYSRRICILRWVLLDQQYFYIDSGETRNNYSVPVWPVFNLYKWHKALIQSSLYRGPRGLKRTSCTKHIRLRNPVCLPLGLSCHTNRTMIWELENPVAGGPDTP